MGQIESKNKALVVEAVDTLFNQRAQWAFADMSTSPSIGPTQTKHF